MSVSWSTCLSFIITRLYLTFIVIFSRARSVRKPGSKKIFYEKYVKKTPEGNAVMPSWSQKCSKFYFLELYDKTLSLVRAKIIYVNYKVKLKN